MKKPIHNDELADNFWITKAYTLIIQFDL